MSMDFDVVQRTRSIVDACLDLLHFQLPERDDRRTFLFANRAGKYIFNVYDTTTGTPKSQQWAYLIRVPENRSSQVLDQGGVMPLINTAYDDGTRIAPMAFCYFNLTPANAEAFIREVFEAAFAFVSDAQQTPAAETQHAK